MIGFYDQNLSKTNGKINGFEKGTKVPQKTLPNRWFFEGSPLREGIVKPYKNQGFRMIFMLSHTSNLHLDDIQCPEAWGVYGKCLIRKCIFQPAPRPRPPPHTVLHF